MEGVVSQHVPAQGQPHGCTALTLQQEWQLCGGPTAGVQLETPV